MNDYNVSENLSLFIELEMKNNPFAILSKVIHDGIYNEIVDGRLIGREKIIESKIAKALNISRTPVKMALNSLQESDILEKRGNSKAFYVKRITYTEGLWLYEARLSLEVQAAYLSAKRINRNELIILKNLIHDFKEIDRTYDNMKFVECDRKFHETIITSTRNIYLINMYKSIECPLQRYRYQLDQLAFEKLFEDTLMERSSMYHEAIYNAIYNKHGLLAKDAIESDLKRMYGTINLLKQATSSID